MGLTGGGGGVHFVNHEAVVVRRSVHLFVRWKAAQFNHGLVGDVAEAVATRSATVLLLLLVLLVMVRRRVLGVVKCLSFVDSHHAVVGIRVIKVELVVAHGQLVGVGNDCRRRGLPQGRVGGIVVDEDGIADAGFGDGEGIVQFHRSHLIAR